MTPGTSLSSSLKLSKTSSAISVRRGHAVNHGGQWKRSLTSDSRSKLTSMGISITYHFRFPRLSMRLVTKTTSPFLQEVPPSQPVSQSLLTEISIVSTNLQLPTRRHYTGFMLLIISLFLRRYIYVYLRATGAFLATCYIHQ